MARRNCWSEYKRCVLANSDGKVGTDVECALDYGGCMTDPSDHLAAPSVDDARKQELGSLADEVRSLGEDGVGVDDLEARLQGMVDVSGGAL